MANIKLEKPNIYAVRFCQEKTDEDYGSCLWARFLLDLDNWYLYISSDCGNYCYGWIPDSDDPAKFIKLLSEVNEDYLFSKLFSQTIVDGEATWENVKDYLDNVLEGQDPDFDLEDVENACHNSSVDEVYSALSDCLLYTNANNSNADPYCLFECISTTYPYAAQKIVGIFKEYVQPMLKEALAKVPRGDKC